MNEQIVSRIRWSLIGVYGIAVFAGYLFSLATH